MATKPVRVLAVKYDSFPIEGTRRTVERCRRLFEICGGSLDLVEDTAAHMYTSNLARAAAEFFSEHLLGKKVEVSDAVSAIEPKDLRCTESGQVRGEFEGARSVHEENKDRLTELEERRPPLPDRRAKALEWLKGRVAKDRKPCELNLRLYLTDQIEGLSVEGWLWWAQEGMFNHAYLFRDCGHAGKKLPVTIAVWDDGTSSIRPHMRWIRETCASGRSVMVLDTSGVGKLEPNSLSPIPVHDFYGTLQKLADDLIWLDDSLAALRIFDALRSIDAAESLPDCDASDIRLYGCGRHGVYARLASVLDGRIKGLTAADEFEGYADWVSSRHYDFRDITSIILPGVLKHFDLSEL